MFIRSMDDWITFLDVLTQYSIRNWQVMRLCVSHLDQTNHIAAYTLPFIWLNYWVAGLVDQIACGFEYMI